jgi:hypothetical protein
MFVRGSESWRFSHGGSGYLETALFIRDAARLPVAPDASVPPRLSGPVPDCSSVLASGDRTIAGQQWATWWYRLVRQTAIEWQRRCAAQPSVFESEQDRGAALRAQVAGRDELFDPPEFAALARLRPLQSVVTSTFASARTWARQPDARQAEDDAVFAGPVVRDVAESTAAELGVGVGAIDGHAYVLPLDGQWSYLAGPGCALCSGELARDPDAAARLLRDIFRSGLAGART